MADDRAAFQSRLAKCFAAAFPGLPAAQIRQAAMGTTRDWDSAATLTLISLIEEEFDCWLGFERAAEMVSFDAVAQIVGARIA
jgi:acyl carrier protein